MKRIDGMFANQSELHYRLRNYSS